MKSWSSARNSEIERRWTSWSSVHHGVVYRVALGILGDVDLAADVAQEAYLKALRALRGFRGESRFRTWLVAIAANEAKGALRRAARRGERSLEAAAHVSAPADDPCDGVAARSCPNRS